MRLGFSRLSNKAACDQASVHSTKKRPTEYTSNAQHVERMHENIMFSLEYQHVIEGSANTKRHTITKTTLTEGVDEKYCGCSGYGCAIRNHDPRTHAEAVGKFPLAPHVAEDSNEKMEYNQW